MVTRRTGASWVVIAAVVALLSSAGAAGASQAPKATKDTRPVLFVGNNWDGTADVVDPQSFKRLERINVIPDKDERLAEIQSDPQKLGYYLAIQQLIGEGHDQYVDDMFTSHDGRFVYVSRPSFADVVGIDLETHKIVWRVPMEGYRADHMAISPDGSRLLVSDSTARKVHVIDPRAGKKVGEFESGDSPHESNYSKDGSKIFHASIGMVYTPADQPVMDSTKGDRWFQVVDAKTNEVVERLDIGQILAANGHEDYSSAVRPMAIAPDENTFYLQLSFLHGFVVFDLDSKKPVRIVDLPVEGDGEGPRETYLLDSAHHGLAINPDGTKLCAAGTMSDYVAIVNTDDFEFTQVKPIDKPYWATNSGDGRYCFVSASGADEVVVIDYATGKEVTRFPVGDHPQRMRMGVIQRAFVAGRGGGNDQNGGSAVGGQDDGSPQVAAAADDTGSRGAPALPATGYGLTFIAVLALTAGALLAARLR
jgi:YVTN family beta-propeller protein